METVVKATQNLSSLGANSQSMCDPGCRGSGSTDAEEVQIVAGASSPKTWKSTESRFWKNSSRTWTARRSAGSPLGELSPSNKFRANNFSRSMSYERIATSYLSGEWPRTFPWQRNRLDSLHHPIILTSDKWTQTTGDINNYECGSSKMEIFTKMPLSTLNCHRKTQNFVERKLASNFLETDPMINATQEPSHGDGLRRSRNKRDGFVDTCHRKHFTANPSGADGFNQEVETLIQHTDVFDSRQLKGVEEMGTPDGHRAPIAELLRMGCPNDRMGCPNGRMVCPNGRMLSGCPADSNSENHFVRISEDIRDSPLTPLTLSDTTDPAAAAVFFDHSTPSGQTLDQYQTLVQYQTLDQYQHHKNVIISPCPVICKSLRKRQAPEGSEMEAKLMVDIRPSVCNISTSPVKMKAAMRFDIPSEHSAFCPLLKKYVGRKSLLTLSLSSRTKGEIQ